MLFFTKLTFLLWSGSRCKTSKKLEKIVSKSICFFTSIFKGFWRQLGWILGPKLGSNKYVAPRLFRKTRARGVQEASKSPKSAPRAAPGCPKSLQERPKSVRKWPKRAQGTPTVPSEGYFLMHFFVFHVFLRFCTFFCVFLWFFAISAFFSVFMCFFFRSNNAQESPKSCFDMVMLKSRIRQRFLESLLLTFWFS